MCEKLESQRTCQLPTSRRRCGFDNDYLGLDVEGFNFGWVSPCRLANWRACVQLVTRDATKSSGLCVVGSRQKRC